MTPQQVAINHAAVTAAAARLTAAGYTGDAARFVESLLLEAIGAGFRPLDRPVPRLGPGGSEEARRAALAATAAAVEAARANRGGRKVP